MSITAFDTIQHGSDCHLKYSLKTMSPDSFRITGRHFSR